MLSRVLLGAAFLLLVGCAPPAEDEAGVPAPADTPVAGDAEAMTTVRQAAAATLAEGGAALTLRLTDDGGGEPLTLTGTDDFEQDRRRLEPRGAGETLFVDGDEVFVRSARLAEAEWARFDLGDVAGEGTAATEDLRLLPLTDSAGVLRTLAEADGEAQRVGEAEAGGDRYRVRLEVDAERGILGGGEDWIERYARAGMDEVDVTVAIDGQRVSEVSYAVPTPADRGLEQGEQVAGEEREGSTTAGLALTIAYDAPTGETLERPGDDEVADVPAEAVAELLEWSPTAGELPDNGDEG